MIPVLPEPLFGAAIITLLMFIFLPEFNRTDVYGVLCFHKVVRTDFIGLADLELYDVGLCTEFFLDYA